jgi:hypothetical protein
MGDESLTRRLTLGLLAGLVNATLSACGKKGGAKLEGGYSNQLGLTCW